MFADEVMLYYGWTLRITGQIAELGRLKKWV